MQHTFLKGTVTVLLLLLVTSLALGQVSVPNLINFQGRLTDGSGNPVADGSHTVNFTLWTLPVAGTNVWTENTSQTTSSGLFTHNLGSVTAFSATLFETYDSLYLQIVADGQTITPRIRLTSTPYTRVSQTLETGLGTGTSIETYNTSHGGNIDLFDEAGNYMAGFEADGNGSGGFIYAYRSPSNLGFYVDGNSGGSNSPTIYMEGNSSFATFEMGATGDATVILPSSAINAAEMSNEPGIAHSYKSGSFVLGAVAAIDTLTITVPTPGYVIITANGWINSGHTNGTGNYAEISINTVAGTHDFDNGTVCGWDNSLPSSTGFGDYMPFYITKVTSVTSGAHTYYFNAGEFTGTTMTIVNRHFTAQFFPTAYGSVDNTIFVNAGATSSSSKPGGDKSYSKVETITVEEHNARVEAEVAKVKAELEARLQKLEQRFNKQDSGVEK